MPKIAVLDDYQHIALTMADWTALGSSAEVTVFNDHEADESALARRLADFDVICVMRERTPMPRTLLERLPNLRLLVTTGARNASIDMEAATEKGITVCHTRGKKHPTPEMTWGLILALARHIPFEHGQMQKGKWQTTVGRTLNGSTLGLLGLGRLGSQVAHYGKAFGMNLIAWSQNLTEERAAEQGAKRVEKDELFSQADFISIHLVLSERTRALVGKHELGLMRPTAYLVNTSRGPIVDEDALVAALQEKVIAGAGLDTYGTEPLPADHPLRSLDNVVLTPHLGYVTEDTMEVFYKDTVENIKAWMDGRPVRVLNPETLK